MLLSMGDRMERKGSKIVCMWTLLGIFVFTVFASPNIEIIYDPEFDYEDYYWTLSGWNFGGMSSGHVQTWQLGIAYLNVSNPDGAGWVGSKIQQGSLPHGWTQAHPLENEFTYTADYQIFLEVKFKLGNWSFLHYSIQAPDNFSWFNFGIGLWFHRPNTSWNGNDSQLVVGAKLIWLRYDGQTVVKQTDDVYFQGDVGNDLHSLFDVYDENITCHDWVTVTVNVTPYIQKALNHWNVANPTLKCIEAYLETIGGKGEIWIDRLSVYAILPAPEQDLIFAFIIILFTLLMTAVVVVFKALTRFRHERRKGQCQKGLSAAESPAFAIPVFVLSFRRFSLLLY
jgi:hypothetical protein